MKKILFISCSLLLITIVGFTVLFNDSTLKAKRTDILKQANGKDVTNLLILKKSPVKSTHNRYEFSTDFPDTLFYNDKYFFKDSTFGSFGVGATIFFDQIYDRNGETELDENTKKITFQDTEALYNSWELVTENQETTYVYHYRELSFLKENIFYRITGTYILDSSMKDTFDFIQFLEENLVPLVE